MMCPVRQVQLWVDLEYSENFNVANDKTSSRKMDLEVNDTLKKAQAEPKRKKAKVEGEAAPSEANDPLSEKQQADVGVATKKLDPLIVSVREAIADATAEATHGFISDKLLTVANAKFVSITESHTVAMLALTTGTGNLKEIKKAMKDANTDAKDQIKRLRAQIKASQDMREYE